LTLAPLCSTDNLRHCKLTPAGPLPHTRVEQRGKLVSGCKSGTSNNSEQPCSGPICSVRLAGPVINCLVRHVLRAWHHVTQDSLISCRNVQRLLTFPTSRTCFLNWSKLSVLSGSNRAVMQYKQQRMQQLKCCYIMRAWTRVACNHELQFGRCACSGAISVFCQTCMRWALLEIFSHWRSLRVCN